MRWTYLPQDAACNRICGYLIELIWRFGFSQPFSWTVLLDAEHVFHAPSTSSSFQSCTRQIQFAFSINESYSCFNLTYYFITYFYLNCGWKYLVMKCSYFVGVGRGTYYYGLWILCGIFHGKYEEILLDSNKSGNYESIFSGSTKFFVIFYALTVNFPVIWNSPSFTTIFRKIRPRLTENQILE